MTKKIPIHTALAVLLGVVLSAPVHAAKEGTWFGEDAAGKWMIGVKAGTVKNGNDDYSDADNAGLVVGYHFARPVGFDGTASLEFEFTQSFNDGNIGGASTFGMPGQWDVETLGLFFAYRTPGMVYFKAKVGGMVSDVNSRFPGAPSVSEDDASLAGGAGLGVKIGEMGNVELEWTGDSGDNDIQFISLGGFLQF